MEEKRKHKRLDLDVEIQLERLDEEGVTTLKYVHVDITDISRSGVGFTCKKELETGTYYDTKIQIWTKEIVDAVIEIVRREDGPDGYRYGAIFIGISDFQRFIRKRKEVACNLFFYDYNNQQNFILQKE